MDESRECRTPDGHRRNGLVFFFFLHHQRVKVKPHLATNRKTRLDQILVLSDKMFEPNDEPNLVNR